MRTAAAVLLVAALAAACARRPAPTPSAVPPPAQAIVLNALDTVEGLDGPGTIELSRDHVQGRRAVKWSVGPGTKHGLRFHFETRGVELAEWGELRFRYKVLTKGWTWFGIKLVDYPVGKGMQATWRLDARDDLEPGDWREAVIDLTNPMYLWGVKPDKQAQWICFRAMADAPASMLLDDVRLARAALKTRLRDAKSSRDPDGTVRCQWTIDVTNPSKARQEAKVAMDAKALRAFRPTRVPNTIALDPGQSARVAAVLTATPQALAKLRPLTTEHATIRFTIQASPEPIVYPVEIEAVTPLPLRQHPMLLVTKDDIAAAKRKAAKHDWARKPYDAIIKGADHWLTREVKLPDRGSQWWHWYSCPKCGTRLHTLSPTKHQCRTCKKIYTGEPYDSVVLSRVHSRLARAIEQLGLAYQFTRDKRYAAKAAEILERYAERYLTYKRHTTRGDDRIGGGRVGPQTLDESTWLIPVVCGYDLIWETLTADQRASIETKLLRPAAELIMEHKLGIHNIQCWKNSAVGLVGICLDEPRFLADAVTSKRGIHAQIAKGILDDGAWYEGAWGYHYYTMSAIKPLAIALRNVGIDVYTDRYKGLYAAPLLYALPNGRLPAVNDSGEANAYGSWYRYELAYARWRDPIFAAVLKGKSRTTRDSLLFGVPQLDEAAALPTGSRNFPVGGYAYLQCDQGKNAPVAILDYAPHGGGHGHPDKLQILLYANGELVSPDPGCIHYGVPLHREWYRQTISHNTVTVDGRSQKPCQGTLRFFHATPELAVASATADDAYDGVRFARTVAMLAGGLCIDVVELTGDKPHTYDWAFHCYGTFATPLPLDKAFAPPGKANSYQRIRSPRGCSTGAPVAATWAGDKTTVSLSMLPRHDTRVFAGDGYGRPPSRKLPTLIVRRRDHMVGFASAWQIGGSRDVTPHLDALGGVESVSLLITAGDEQAVVRLPLACVRSFPQTEKLIEPVVAVHSDARVAMARSRKGKPRAFAFADGKRLEAGSVVLATSRKATLSLSYKPRGKSLLVLDAKGETTLRLTGLFAEGCQVTDQSDKPMATSWRRGTLRFTAKPGRYTIAPPGK